MADKNNITYKKGIVPRGPEFQDTLKLKGTVLAFIRETLESSTEKAFVDLGFQKSDKPSGFYGDGRAYGMGTATSFFNVKIAGQTQNMMQKLISFGGKRMVVDINVFVHPNSETMDMSYKTTEASAFRGYSSPTGPMMISEQLHYDLKNMEKFKKEFNETMDKFSAKEVAYMTSTKLGTEDAVEKSTASMVESNGINIHDVLFANDEDFLKKLNETMNDPFAVVDNMEQPEDNLLLSDKDLSEDEYGFNRDDRTLDKSVFGAEVVITDERDENGHFGQKARVIDHVRPSVMDGNLISYVLEFPGGERETYLRSQFAKEEEAMANVGLQDRIKEITSVGGAGAVGAIGYDAPFDKPAKRKFADTEFGKRERLKEGMGNWAPMLTEGSDGFWTVVSQDTLNRYKSDHIMGAPGAEDIEINSESEEQFNSGGINKFPQGKAFKDGDFERYNASLKEAEEAQKKSVQEYLRIDPSVRKKWNRSEAITESAQRSRWERLSTFEDNETIKLAEMSGSKEKFDEPMVKKAGEDIEVPLSRNHNIDEGDVVDGKTVIKVSKKNSLYNIEYLVNEEDYLNKGKAYIHDYVTGNLVNNPNYDATI